VIAGLLLMATARSAGFTAAHAQGIAAGQRQRQGGAVSLTGDRHNSMHAQGEGCRTVDTCT
jgi:hypothetical protein